MAAAAGACWVGASATSSATAALAASAELDDGLPVKWVGSSSRSATAALAAAVSAATWRAAAATASLSFWPRLMGAGPRPCIVLAPSARSAAARATTLAAASRPVLLPEGAAAGIKGGAGCSPCSPSSPGTFGTAIAPESAQLSSTSRAGRVAGSG